VRTLTAILGVLVLGFGASHALASPEGSDASSGDWVYADHDLAGTRYSHLTQITTKNVSQLVKACAETESRRREY
jgi:glucose dehydrogenase